MCAEVAVYTWLEKFNNWLVSTDMGKGWHRVLGEIGSLREIHSNSFYNVFCLVRGVL